MNHLRTASIVLLALLFAGCTQSPIDRLLNTLGGVSIACAVGQSTVLSLQTQNAISSEDALLITGYLRDVGFATGRAITEARGPDTMKAKYLAIGALYAAIPIRNVTDPKVRAIVQGVQSAVQVLLSQLQSIAMAMPDRHWQPNTAEAERLDAIAAGL